MKLTLLFFPLQTAQVQHCQSEKLCTARSKYCLYLLRCSRYSSGLYPCEGGEDFVTATDFEVGQVLLVLI